jgi:hypothetical protein
MARVMTLRLMALAGLVTAMTGCVQVPVHPPAVPPAPVASAPGPTMAPPPASAPPVSSGPKAPATPKVRKPVPPAPAARPAAPASSAPVAAPQSANPARPATPALDLAALEQRLRDTRAIGVFTKLSLKNQVDDLLARFRDFYARKGSLTLGDLRQRYDLLLLKVLSVLQDGDPALASAISTSREVIWAILADPQKFGKLGF